MARVPIPIPGKDKDYDSRKSRAQLVNLMVDLNQDGSFKAITKREGVFAVDTTQGDDLISNFALDGAGNTYISGETNLYKVGLDGILLLVGPHGVALPAPVAFLPFTGISLLANDLDPDPQIFAYATHPKAPVSAAVIDPSIGNSSPTNTTLTQIEIATSTTLHVVNDGGILSGDIISVVDDNGDLFWTTVNGSPAGNVVTITDALTTGAPNGAAVFATAQGVGQVTAVTDVTWAAKGGQSGTYLNTQFWFVSAEDQSVFYGSNSLDGLVFDPSAFATADEEVGVLLATRAYKSSVWFFKSRSIEYWSIFNDVTVPLRRVTGASKRIGLAGGDQAEFSYGDYYVAQLYEYIGFLGSDQRVYLMTGSEMEVVSDIDFANIMTDNSAGHTIGDSSALPKIFFVDTGNHRYLCATSSLSTAAKKFTWVYDLKTRQSHYRTSPTLDYWDYGHSSTFGADSIFGQRVFLVAAEPSDTIYQMTRSDFDDDGTDFECILQTGSVSYDKDSTIEHIEIEMETGVGNADSADPEMVVEYSKDGGVNFFTHSTVKLGASTDKSNRITLYNFGRLVRHTDFVLRLTIEEPVRVEFYGIYAEITSGF